jgi:ADP-ribosylglycohydrolase
MRAPVLALFFARDKNRLLAAARDSAKVTHAHPLGVEGAVLIALAAHALLQGHAAEHLLATVRAECLEPQMAGRLATVNSWIAASETPTAREVAAKLGNGITAPTSCPTALYVALRHLPSSFEAMMEFTFACRGDVDTIGAMAGALWGLANGAERLPAIRLEARDRITDVAARLFHKHVASPSSASAADGE